MSLSSHIASRCSKNMCSTVKGQSEEILRRIYISKLDEKIEEV